MYQKLFDDLKYRKSFKIKNNFSFNVCALLRENSEANIVIANFLNLRTVPNSQDQIQK